MNVTRNGKRILSMILVALLLSLCPFTVWAADLPFVPADPTTRDGQGLEFALSSTTHTAKLTWHVTSAEGGNIVIPSTVSYEDEEYTVTEIQSVALSNWEKLTSLTIPDTITKIGNGALGGCSNLTNVVIAEANPKYKVEQNCVIDTSTNTVIAGFCGCSIPDGIECIAEDSLSNCSGLTSVTIPASVTKIGRRAFSKCSELTSITVSPQNTVYRAEGNCVIEKETNSLIAACKNSVIPDFVTSISANGFYGCSGLETVTIPASVEYIGECAFASCADMTEIIIPGTVKSIDNSAFNYCKNLTSVTLLDGIETIGTEAFSYCEKMTQIMIPDSVINVGTGMFKGCSNLTTISCVSGSNAANRMKSEYSGKLKLLCKVTLPEAPAGYMISANDLGVNYVSEGEDFSFGVTPGVGYKKDFVVKVNGTPLIGTEGIYTIKNITNNKVVTIENAMLCDHKGCTWIVDEGDMHKCLSCDVVMKHSWEVDATDPTKHKCSVCDCTETHTIDANAEWEKESTIHYHVCEKCGTHVDEGLHVWDDATCQLPKKCSVCDKTEGNALGHEWKPDPNNNNQHICVRTNCDATENHSGGSATCTKQAECDLCHEKYGAVDETAHIPGPEPTETEPQRCTECGRILRPAAGHKTHIADAARWYWDEEFHWHQCIGCATEKLDKASHTYGEWVTVTPATTTTVGMEKRSCSVCNFEQTREIAVTQTPEDTITPEQIQENSIQLNTGIMAKWKGSKFTVTWGKVTDAEGYEVFAAPCAKKMDTKIPAKTVEAKKTSATLTKIAGKKLSAAKSYMVMVKAYKVVNGEKVYIGSSQTCHVAGKNDKTYTNAKKVTVSRKKVTLKKGKTSQIKATIVKESKQKKLLGKSHGASIRYFSTDTDIATVTAKGKIKALDKGTCYIYVKALNGVGTRVKVTVK